MTKWSHIRNTNLKIIMSLLQVSVLLLNLSDLWIKKKSLLINIQHHLNLQLLEDEERHLAFSLH